MTASINFVNAHLNPDEAIPDYLVGLTGLKDRMVECGDTVDESIFKGLMFQGLSKEYNVIKTNVKPKLMLSSISMIDLVVAARKEKERRAVQKVIESKRI